MKRFIQFFLTVCMVVFSAQVAFANTDKVTLYEGADITAVHRMALALPRYTPIGENAPDKEALNKIVYKASDAGRCYVIAYDEMAENIKSAGGADIKVLDYRKAMKIFKENADKYADAYVILTVANNSRTSFFFDVYKSGTNELLYTYQIFANKHDKDDENTYKLLSEQFFKQFEVSVKDQMKKKK